MAFLFPSNYKPKINLADTLIYINRYREFLIKLLIAKYNLINIEAPIVADLDLNTNNFKLDARLIDFDNKTNYKVYELYNDISLWIKQKMKQFNVKANNGLYTIYKKINRDSKLNNLDSMIQEIIHLEYRPIEELNNQKGINQLFFELIQSIVGLNEIEIIKGHKTNKFFQKDKSPKFITLKELVHIYPTIDVNKALKDYIRENGPTVLFSPMLETINGTLNVDCYAMTDDYNLTGILYVYNRTTDQVVPLVKISSRPSQEAAYDQTIGVFNDIFEKGIYNKKILKAFDLKSIGIDIYFSNLMLVCLQKVHLAEVVSSVWKEDLIEYCKENDIEIF